MKPKKTIPKDVLTKAQATKVRIKANKMMGVKYDKDSAAGAAN